MKEKTNTINCCKAVNRSMSLTSSEKRKNIPPTARSSFAFLRSHSRISNIGCQNTNPFAPFIAVTNEGKLKGNSGKRFHPQTSNNLRLTPLREQSEEFAECQHSPPIRIPLPIVFDSADNVQTSGYYALHKRHIGGVLKNR